LPLSRNSRRDQIQFDEVERFVLLSRDPKDQSYLNLAIQADAKYLVSRDRDLLEGAASLAALPSALRILDPIQFLAAIRESVKSI
jgi:predicted nucleic acid-binding protein